jgi:hypothetical protein
MPAMDAAIQAFKGEWRDRIVPMPVGYRPLPGNVKKRHAKRESDKTSDEFMPCLAHVRIEKVPSSMNSDKRNHVSLTVHWQNQDGANCFHCFCDS